MAAAQPVRPPLTAQAQGQALVEFGVDGGAKQIIKGSQTHASVLAVKQSDVFAMGIGIADQEIEADPPQQPVGRPQPERHCGFAADAR